MKTLIIDNVGPLNHVELNLKQINVIIGPQSAGKSCILKIACFCAWAEKRVQMEQGKNGFADFGYVAENLVKFHKMDGFFSEESRVEYKSDTVGITIDFKEGGEMSLDWGHGAKRWQYRRTRVSYIPAERNLLSTIPNWFDVRMDGTNLKSFMGDWNYAHKMCGDNALLPILGLGVKYYYDKSEDKDYVMLDNGTRLELQNASSGLQSVVPMWVYLDYLFTKQYLPGEMSNSRTESENEEIARHIYESKFKKGLKKAAAEGTLIVERVGLSKRSFASKKDFEECNKLVQAYTVIDHSDIYLEEPEQNLFPATQAELIRKLLEMSSIHKDGLFIATHSPYILFSLNNCLLGGMVGNKIPDEIKTKFGNKESWIEPSKVSVWEIRDGEVKNLQDKNGLIRDNYFNRVMKQVMGEFSNLTAFYE